MGTSAVGVGTFSHILRWSLSRCSGECICLSALRSAFCREQPGRHRLVVENPGVKTRRKWPGKSTCNRRASARRSNHPPESLYPKTRGEARPKRLRKSLSPHLCPHLCSRPTVREGGPLPLKTEWTLYYIARSNLIGYLPSLLLCVCSVSGSRQGQAQANRPLETYDAVV